MNPIDITLTKWKVIGGCIALLMALAAAAVGGAEVNGWRLDAVHLRALATEKDRYDALAEKVREQSRAVEALGASTKVAQDQAELAKHYAAGLSTAIDRRAADVAASSATNCDGVLRAAWGRK